MSTDHSILVIDDEQSICFAFKRYFESRGTAVAVAHTVRDGRAKYLELRPDVVFLDVRLGDGSGLDLLESLRRDDPGACVVMITAYGSLDTVTRAIRNKAFDYLVKPLDLDRAGEVFAQALASRAAPQSVSDSDGRPAGAGTAIVGSSPAIQEVFKRIGRVSQADASVLIHGQTGTGKELVARVIHEHSPREARPFVTVNCAALPENLVESELFGYARGAFTGADADKPGRFEMAHTGTLFLDEIGELPMAAQVKLLRFLDSQTIERLGSVSPICVDVRILAATNRDLPAEVEAGRFREDLYYRLAVIQIEVPPLAQRRQDIAELTHHFLAQFAPGRGISDEAMAALTGCDWPGNVRQLRNALEHAAVVSGTGPILPAHLPEAVQTGEPGGQTPAGDALISRYLDQVQPGPDGLHQSALAPIERAVIVRALAETGGKQGQAAKLLGIHRNTLRAKLRDLGIDSEE